MIRRYRQADVPVMLEHIAKFLVQSENFKGIGYDRDKIRMLLLNNLANQGTFFCNVGVDENDEVIGGLCAVLQQYSFSKAVFCMDMLFYIPEERRGLKLATELVASYVTWAKARGVKECRLANSTGVRPEAYGRLCEKLGFSYLGPIYQMRF